MRGAPYATGGKMMGCIAAAGDSVGPTPAPAGGGWPTRGRNGKEIGAGVVLTTSTVSTSGFNWSILKSVRCETSSSTIFSIVCAVDEDRRLRRKLRNASIGKSA